MKCPECGCSLKLVSDNGSTDAGTDGLEALLDSIHEDELEHENSVKFVQETKARFAQYGERTKISDKQMAWLRKLAAK